MAEWGLDRGTSGPAADAWRRQQAAGTPIVRSPATGTEIADAVARGASDRDEMLAAIDAARAAR